MITTLRRFVLFVALMVWQGEFMFYGGVVVEVGAAVLGSHRMQGFVTQKVTNYLNLAGTVALAVWGWDIAAGGAGWRRTRWASWGVLVALLVALVCLHPSLDDLLAADEFRVLDRRGYRRLHQWYLGLSSVQWAGAMALTGWTVWTWRAEDAARGAGSGSAGVPPA